GRGDPRWPHPAIPRRSRSTRPPENGGSAPHPGRHKSAGFPSPAQWGRTSEAASNGNRLSETLLRPPSAPVPRWGDRVRTRYFAETHYIDGFLRKGLWRLVTPARN